MKIPVCNYERALTRITETKRKAGIAFNGNVYLDVPEYYAVVEALEKQIPKKVTYEATLLRCCTCPTCKNVVDKFEKWGESTVRITYNHCQICGQALDWSDEERKGKKMNAKSSNVKELKNCPMCDKPAVFASYEENRRYKYECDNCGQYFEFNAPSQFAADIIFNEVIRGRISERKGEENVQVTD